MKFKNKKYNKKKYKKTEEMFCTKNDIQWCFINWAEWLIDSWYSKHSTPKGQVRQKHVSSR